MSTDPNDLPPAVPPALDWSSPMPPAPAAPDVVQAGFLRRWAAFWLDSLILTSGLYGLFFIAFIIFGVAGGLGALAQMDPENPPAWLVGAYLGIYLVYFLCAGLYYSIMESSRAQATVGKMALGIKVVDANGARLSWPHALGRWFAAALSYITLYIGFIVAGFTEKKQALHDLVVGTYVVDKWAYTATPERQQRGLSGCLIAFLVVAAMFVVIGVLGILAAIALPAYQDYATRAHSVTALVAAAPLKTRVVEALASGGECPSNTGGVERSEGFLAPLDYAGTAVARIVVDRIDAVEDGGCGITVWLKPVGGSTVEQSIQLEYLPEAEKWVCTSSLPAVQLPVECR